MRYILLLTLFISTTGCNKKPFEDSLSTRATAIPSSAFWVGGHDGGVFVSITKLTDTDKRAYWGEILYVSGDTRTKVR